MPSLTRMSRRVDGNARLHPTRRVKHLNDAERRQAYEMLLAGSDNGVLRYGAFAFTAQHFGCSWRTISRLWASARLSIRDGSLTAVTSTKIKGNSGTTRKRSKEEIELAIKSVAQHDRQTLRSLEVHSSIPKTTLINHMKESKLKAKSNYVNPMLTEENKEDRFRFALNFLEPRSNGSHVFANMHEYVHVDEKWFFLTKVKKKFYVYDDE
ncbi:hypothetical protein As57867_003286, partial [Aphanomyces stellatus]